MTNTMSNKQRDAKITIEIITTLMKYDMKAEDGVLFLRELSYSIERQCTNK